jgi:hypothetical protein
MLPVAISALGHVPNAIREQLTKLSECVCVRCNSIAVILELFDSTIGNTSGGAMEKIDGVLKVSSQARSVGE